MSVRSTEYLESMLDEYNGKVNSLIGGDAAELMEACMNRGCILVMLGHQTSAMDDFETVLELAETMESEGRRPEGDTVFKALTTMGLALYAEGQEFLPALEAASAMVPSLGRNVGHFDRRSLTRTCLDCADALMDKGSYEHAAGFLRRVLEDTDGSMDRWSRNKHAEAMLMTAECGEMSGRESVAASVYTDTIAECKALMMDESLDNMDTVINAFMGRALCHNAMGDREAYVEDLMSGAEAIKAVHEAGGTYDRDTEAEVNNLIARELASMGRDAEAERYMLRSMTIGLEASAELNKTDFGDDDGDEGWE